MERKERWLLDKINDIKKIILSEWEGCDADYLIEEVNESIVEIGELRTEAQTQEENQRLDDMQEKADSCMKLLQKFKKAKSEKISQECQSER